MQELLRLAVCVCLAGSCSAFTARADVKLPELFSDNMVLQRDMPVPLWGTAEPGERVSVSVAGRTAEAVAGADGNWMATLEPMPAGGPHELTVAGDNAITISNVLLGEVWLCSGQSNMDFKVKSSINGEQEVAAADHPNLRLCFVRWGVAREPQSNPRGKWEPCTPKSAENFSAVAYFFGRDLQKDLGVPVGLVWVSCGWTPSEAWTSREGLSSEPEIKRDVLDRWDRLVELYPGEQRKYEEGLAEWKKAKETAEADGKPFDAPEPKRPPNPQFIHMATGLYNGGIAPLVPFAIRGAIWYQGETNADRAIQYRKLFPMLIADWRRAWDRPDMPFLFAQIANLGELQTQPADGDRAELRGAQLLTFKQVPHTAMAVTIDIGDALDEHPRNKQDVGARLAVGARAVAYGQDVVYSGPIYRSMEVEGNKVRLTFDHVGGGLETKNGGPLPGFAIAGDDKKFVWAEAVIDGDTVVARSDTVRKPVAVRYGWANNPIISLYNKEGLPAAPFRTDDWPGVTTGKTKLWIEQVYEWGE